MHAGVRFQSDSTVGVVPITYVKNFKLPYDANKTYQAFWSPNPDEEPNMQHKNMDKMYKSLNYNKEKKGSLPPSGYYNAKILCIADTFEETRESLNALGLPLQKRTVEKLSKSSSIKLISSAASSVIRAGIGKCSLTFTDDEDSDEDETVEPVRNYKERLEYLESQNSKLEADMEFLKSQLMQTEEQLKEAKEETKSVSEKLMHTKEKYKSLKEEFKTARQLNYELQRKLIGSFRTVVVSPNSIESNYNHSTREMEPPSPSLISNAPGMKRSNIGIVDQRQQSPKMAKIDENDDDMAIDDTQELSFETVEITESVASSSSFKDGNFFLSDEIIKSSSMGCRSGKDGDKVYVKNLAVNLFGKNILMNSSVTGRKPPTGGKPARPALPRAGIVYLKNLLENRVHCELKLQKDLTEDEKNAIITKRSSFVVVIQAIGDKISSLRRVNK